VLSAGASTCVGCVGTPTPLSIDGQGNIVVPAGATLGTYTVPYRLCAFASTTTCDTANATVRVIAVTISGTVFNDANGNKLQDTPTESGASAPIPSGVNAILLNNSNTVVAVTSVSTANGAYSFAVDNDGTYVVIVSTLAPALGATLSLPTVSSPGTLPAGWVHTGDNRAGVVDPNAGDGVIAAISVSGVSVSGLNFGIEQAPTAGGAVQPMLPNPGSAGYPMPSALLVTGSSDPVPGVNPMTAFLLLPTASSVSKLPLNVKSLVVRPITYDASNPIPTTGVAVSVAQLAAGDVIIQPESGNVSIQMPFRAIDNAGVTSQNVGIAELSFGEPDVFTRIDASSAAPGTATVSVQYGNAGTVPALDVLVTAKLVPGLSSSQVIATGSGVYDSVSGIVIWPQIPTLAVAQQGQFTVQITGGLPIGGRLTFLSNVTTSGNETLVGNNPSAAALTVAAPVPALPIPWLIAMIMLIAFVTRTSRRAFRKGRR
jgi:hypothetical protein